MMRRRRILLGILIMSLLSESARAQSGERPIEYTVRAGDTCADIAERFYGSRSFYFVIHDYNPHALRDRRQCDEGLRPGTALRLPRHAPTATSDADADADAEVTAVLRRVKSRSPDRTEWGEAHRGQDLFRGWRVNTLEESAADVTFRDTSVLHLRDNTLVIIFGPMARRARRAASKAVLEVGELRSRLSELSGGLQIETPSARAQLGQGLALVSVDEERTSRVANHEGAESLVTSKAGRGAVKVRAGMGTKVKRGGRPTPPRPLPARPVWAADEPVTFINVAGRGATLTGSWSPVEGAASYRVEIATQPDGRGPMGATGVPATVTRFELRGLRPGNYYVSVAAIDDDRFEGRASPWRPVRMVEAELITPFEELSEADGGELHVVRGSRLRTPRGVRCALGVGVPVADMIFDQIGRESVRCVDEEGQATSSFEVVVVDIRLEPREVAAGESLRLPRGQRSTVQLDLQSEITPPEGLEVTGGPGVRVESIERNRGVLSVTLFVADDAPETSSLDLQARAGGEMLSLSSITLETSVPVPARGSVPNLGATTEPVDEERELRLAAHEASALMSGPFAFGVRDEQRSGASLWAGFGFLRDLGEDEAHQYLPSFGVDVGLVGDRMRLGLGFPISLQQRVVGFNANVGWRVVSGAIFGLAVDLGTWIPVEAPQGRDYRARLVPSVDLSIRLDERWVFRTRQGLMLDTAADGAFLWSSAYAVDVKLVGPVGIGLEGLMLFGVDDDAPLVAPALAIALGLNFGVVELALAGRLAVTDTAADLLGELSTMMILRVSP